MEAGDHEPQWKPNTYEGLHKEIVSLKNYIKFEKHC